MKQAIGQFVEGKANIVEAMGQSGKNIGELAAARGFMRSDQLVVTATDLLIKFKVGRTPKAAAVSILVKNAADEKRVISNVRSKQEGLLGRGLGKGDQHIGNIFGGVMPELVRAL